MSREEQVEKFMAVYVVELPKMVKKYPLEYGVGFDVEKCADNMRRALVASSYNHVGHGITATCKVLGIKPTRKAIEAFFEKE